LPELADLPLVEAEVPDVGAEECDFLMPLEVVVFHPEPPPLDMSWSMQS
jgi:hypothetical protein